MADWVHYLISFAVGAGAGLFGGMFGVSGGSIAIPSMALLGHTQQVAQGTSLVMQLPNLALGAWHYTKRGRINVRAAIVLSVAAIPFTYLGAVIATHMPSRELRIAFGMFFIALATFQLWNAWREGRGAVTLPMRWYYLAALGLIAGFSTGLFGLGGPALAIPTLVLFFGVAQTVAQGMALYLSAPGTLITLGTYAHEGDVDWGAGIALALGAGVLVKYGVALAHRLPEKVLRVLFGFFLYAVAALLLREATR